jgi:hypothetical protein
MAQSCEKCGREFATVEDIRELDVADLTKLCMKQFALRDPDAEKDCEMMGGYKLIKEQWNNPTQEMFRNQYLIQHDINFLLNFIKRYVGV